MRSDIPLILAIESSCDETAAAVTWQRKVLSNVVASQIDIHRRFGGVVPEIASRNHTLALPQTVWQALMEADVPFSEIDAVAVTYGAGLQGALLSGVSYAKAMAYAAKKKLYAVNHLQGHIAANYIDCDLRPPYLCLVVSGGNTAICDVPDYLKANIMGETVDDAAGEAFDKVARVLGLPYPGGPEIEKIAKQGQAAIAFPKANLKDRPLDFSFSGLKTAVINYVHGRRQKNEDIPVTDIAASFQKAVADVLTEHTIKAARRAKRDKIVIAGGVGANGYLRETLEYAAKREGFRLFYPPLKYCGDNAAMIGVCCYYMMEKGMESAPLSLESRPSLKINDLLY